MPDEFKMTIRLQPDLRERLRLAAERDHRSMHAQMIAYIERGLAQDEAPPGRRPRQSPKERGRLDGT